MDEATPNHQDHLIKSAIETFFTPVFALLGEDSKGLSIPQALAALSEKNSEIGYTAGAYGDLDSETGVIAALTQMATGQNLELQTLLDNINLLTKNRPDIRVMMTRNAFSS